VGRWRPGDGLHQAPRASRHPTSHGPKPARWGKPALREGHRTSAQRVRVGVNSSPGQRGGHRRSGCRKLGSEQTVCCDERITPQDLRGTRDRGVFLSGGQIGVRKVVVVERDRGGHDAVAVGGGAIQALAGDFGDEPVPSSSQRSAHSSPRRQPVRSANRVSEPRSGERPEMAATRAPNCSMTVAVCLVWGPSARSPARPCSRAPSATCGPGPERCSRLAGPHVGCEIGQGLVRLPAAPYEALVDLTARGRVVTRRLQ
jgi:hypothetical protein